MPGPTQDVLGKVEDGAVIDITGTGVTTYKDSGKLLLTTDERVRRARVPDHQRAGRLGLVQSAGGGHAA